MDKHKKMSKKIFSHVLEILSLLTGEVSVFQHLTDSLTVLEMNKDKKMTERILNLTLDIIYLLTGEEYTIVKKNSAPSSIHQLTREFVDGRRDKIDKNLQALRTSGNPVNASSGHVNPSVLSQLEQEAEPNVRYYPHVKEENIPVNISDGLQENPDTLSDIKEHEDGIDENDILQVTIHSDLCAERNIPEDHHVPNCLPDHIMEDFSVLHSYPAANQFNRTIRQNLNGPIDTLERTLHTGERQNVFSDYGKGPAVNKVYLKQSAREKIFACTDCERAFTCNANLVKHQRVHTGEKPFVCSDCGKCFTTNSNLKDHRRTHTGEKPFPCSECGKCFSWLSSLNEHKKTHTGEKPFICSECGKGFSQVSNLNVHKKTHSEETFACSECGKCFCKKGHLVRHQRSHTGESHFICSECGESFSQRSELNKHKKVHT
ncbi:uncharacterized protein O3C94_016822 [Discoglossus pictus]